MKRSRVPSPPGCLRVKGSAAAGSPRRGVCRQPGWSALQGRPSWLASVNGSTREGPSPHLPFWSPPLQVNYQKRMETWHPPNASQKYSPIAVFVGHLVFEAQRGPYPWESIRFLFSPTSSCTLGISVSLDCRLQIMAQHSLAGIFPSGRDSHPVGKGATREKGVDRTLTPCRAGQGGSPKLSRNHSWAVNCLPGNTGGGDHRGVCRKCEAYHPGRVFFSL